MTEPEKKVKQPAGTKKGIRWFIILIVLAVLAGSGTFGWMTYIKMQKEAARKQQEDERLRREQEAKKKHDQELAAQRALFDRLLREMKAAFQRGNFRLARKLGAEALVLAKKYNFPTAEILALLDRMDAIESERALARLDETAKDIFLYQKLRQGLSAVPRRSFNERHLDALYAKSYRNEYQVALYLARQTIDKAGRGEEPSFHYLMSKTYLARAVAVRTRHGISPDITVEDGIRTTQRTVFFASENLRRATTPTGIYTGTP